MGQSTDAILVYGMTIDEMEVDEEDMHKAEEELDEREDGVVKLIRHCSCNYPMWILGIGFTRKVAYRGSPTLLSTYGTADAFGFNANWPRLIQEVAKEFDIPIDHGKFGWWLASDWC